MELKSINGQPVYSLLQSKKNLLTGQVIRNVAINFLFKTLFNLLVKFHLLKSFHCCFIYIYTPCKISKHVL